MDAPEIFDRNRRRLARDRAAPRFAEHAFVRETMLDTIGERLAAVKRDFGDVLDVGAADGAFTLTGARITRVDPGRVFAAQSGGVQADEDQAPYGDGAFDLAIAAGTLDTVNDLPGALTLIRRALRPDGLFLGAFLGAGTLQTLRAVFREAEGERPAARFHPLVDVRSAGDLLVRAGFALPVADAETLTVRYADLSRLLADVRGMAGGNLLAEVAPLRRETIARAAAAFEARKDAGGRVAERFEIIVLTGWAPSPDQPQPARRGSATASLTTALKADEIGRP
jgi:SAM-dependent methyltransferase